MSTQSRKKARGTPPAAPAPVAAEPVATMTVVPVDQLIPDAGNVRRRDDRANQAIDASLAQFGPGRSILVGNKRIVRAGNGTLERFAAGGGTEVLLVRPKPGQLVAVERIDLTPTQEVGLGIADNRTADLATNDDIALAEQLRALQSEDFPIEAAGYTDDEVDELIERLGKEAAGGGGSGGGADPGPQIDKAAELQKKWGTKRGQLWSITSSTTCGGWHSLLCGDSTNPIDVARVMGDDGKAALFMTSPPYWAKQAYDTQPGMEAVRLFMRAIVGVWLPFVSRRCCVVTGNTNETSIDKGGECSVRVMLDAEWADAFAEMQWPLRHRRVWVKGGALAHIGPMNDSCDQSCEYLLTFFASGHNAGGQERVDEPWAQSGFWDDLPGGGESVVGNNHPCPYPVEIPARFIKLYSVAGDAIAEPFSGSGATIVAAEQTGRLCRGIEIEPKYVAVALERLAGMGLAPRLAS